MSHSNNPDASPAFKKEYFYDCPGNRNHGPHMMPITACEYTLLLKVKVVIARSTNAPTQPLTDDEAEMFQAYLSVMESAHTLPDSNPPCAASQPKQPPMVIEQHQCAQKDAGHQVVRTKYTL